MLTQHTVSRRKLLPLWIKIFTWIFMVMGALAILGIPAGLIGARFNIAIYGMQSTDPLSPVGLFATAILVFKGVVAYCLWTEKDWAVTLGVADAILGILACSFMMVVVPFLGNNGPASFEFRLELALLIPFLLKMLQIQLRWSAP